MASKETLKILSLISNGTIEEKERFISLVQKKYPQLNLLLWIGTGQYEDETIDVFYDKVEEKFYSLEDSSCFDSLYVLIDNIDKYDLNLNG